MHVINYKIKLEFMKYFLHCSSLFVLVSLCVCVVCVSVSVSVNCSIQIKHLKTREKKRITIVCMSFDNVTDV